MTRAVPLLTCVLLVACTRALPPKALVQAPASAPTSGGVSVELPRIGVRLRAPVAMKPLEFDQQVGDGPIHVEGAECAIGAQTFSIFRYFREGRDRIADAKLLENGRQDFVTVARESELWLGEFRGLELEGTTKKGAHNWLRAYALGDGFLLAQVTQPKGAIERDSARAFLDSISLSVPWSVQAFPVASLAVWLPQGGIRLDKKALSAESFTLAEGIFVGGKENRIYVVYSMPLSGEKMNPDERMDIGAEALIEKGTRIVWQGPIDFEGARGRDYLLESTGSWQRLRIVLTDTDLYMLQASAISKSALLNDEVQRFLDSLRWYPER